MRRDRSQSVEVGAKGVERPVGDLLGRRTLRKMTGESEDRRQPVACIVRRGPCSAVAILGQVIRGMAAPNEDGVWM